MPAHFPADDIYMELAVNMAQCSHCVYKLVGAVLTKENRVVSVGYNGPPSGTRNCDEIFAERLKNVSNSESKNMCSMEKAKPGEAVNEWKRMKEAFQDMQKGETLKIAWNRRYPEEAEEKQKEKEAEEQKEKAEIRKKLQSGSDSLVEDLIEWHKEKVQTAVDARPKCFMALHAEHNAILFASKQGISLEGATLYTTLSPCLQCARVIYEMRIGRVVYLEDYAEHKGLSRNEGFDFLENCAKEGGLNIKIEQYGRKN